MIGIGKEIYFLLKKEWTIEFRHKAALSGLILYLFGAAFICFFTLRLRQNLVTPPVWSALFWITILFTAVNAVAKSFIGEKKETGIYYYSVSNPSAIILSKILYNTILCLFLSFFGYGLFVLLLGNPIQDTIVFFSLILLISNSFASTLTLLSHITAKAGNNMVLMAILSFPVVTSILLLAVKVTRNCINDLGWETSWHEMITLLAVNCLTAALSYILFPYIWRI